SSQPVIIGAKAMPIIDIPSIHKHFPRNAKPPEQLIQLLEWLQSSRYGHQLWGVDFMGTLLDSFWIVNQPAH
ncbi:MAG: hypothetical protein AAF728_11970, partial [Cyanobacteria bacterium P01_D01_bin.128]